MVMEMRNSKQRRSEHPAVAKSSTWLYTFDNQIHTLLYRSTKKKSHMNNSSQSDLSHFRVLFFGTIEAI